MNIKPSTVIIRQMLAVDPTQRGMVLKDRLERENGIEESRSHCDKVRSSFLKTLRKNKAPMLHLNGKAKSFKAAAEIEAATPITAGGAPSIGQALVQLKSIIFLLGGREATKSVVDIL